MNKVKNDCTHITEEGFCRILGGYVKNCLGCYAYHGNTQKKVE